MHSIDIKSLFIGIMLSALIVITIGATQNKTNRFSVVLPGQTWYLPGTGAVKIVHSSEPGSEILYVYNLEDGIETAMGVCSRNDLIKGGFLIDLAVDSEEPLEEERPVPDLRVIQFPGKDESKED